MPRVAGPRSRCEVLAGLQPVLRGLRWRAAAAQLGRTRTMSDPTRFLDEHLTFTRRYFLGLGAVGAMALRAAPVFSADKPANAVNDDAVNRLGEFLTRPEKFRDVSRGKPLPHSLPDEKKVAVGLTRETWTLEVLSDPDN